MIHMYLFHLHMLSAEESVAESWSQAAKQLYNLTHEDAAKLLKFFVEIWDEMAEDGKKPNSFVPGGKKLLKTVLELGLSMLKMDR